MAQVCATAGILREATDQSSCNTNPTLAPLPFLHPTPPAPATPSSEAQLLTAKCITGITLINHSQTKHA